MKDAVPASPSRLIGRDREVAELRSMLVEGARLVTLTGAGGSGKTRLALAVAESVADEFATGAFVDLSALRDPSLVPQAIATALKAPRGAARSPFEAVVQHIGSERVLILLDNFEQLLPESSVVSDLLAACAALVVIATSRAPLELRWERVYPVGPLATPDAADQGLAALRRSPAVLLFCERVRAVRPLFTLDERTAGPVANIVRRLDGLPLAIELAAARARILSVAEIAARVDHALDLLGEAEHDRPARQRTIRATIDWSLELLNDAQRRLLRRLAAFDGGATLDAIGEVCGGSEGPVVLDDLEDLVQAGIATSSEVAGETRITLPVTVRERAQELLDVEGERDEVAARHLRYFTSLVRRADEATKEGESEAAWLSRIEADRANIRSALRSALGPHSREPAAGIEIGARMLGPWYAFGAHDEALRWIDLALATDTESPHRIQVICNGGWFSYQLGDLARAERYYRAVIEMAPRVGRPDKLLDVAELGRIARDRGDEDAAVRCYDEALRLLDALSLPDGSRASYLWGAAECLRWFARTERAEALASEALRAARAGGQEQATVASLTTLAYLARSRGDLDESEALLQDAWVTVSAMGHRVWQRNVLTARILSAVDLARLDAAAELCWQSLRVAREAGDRTAAAASWIDALASAASALGRHGEAIRLFAYADTLRTAVGVAVPVVDSGSRQRSLDSVVSVIRERARASSHEDRSLSTLFTFAERLFAPAQPPAVALSRREREVASLVVRGLSNRDIAQRLILGERTVETHVERVLRKLEVRSRHDVAARAEELALAL